MIHQLILYGYKKNNYCFIINFIVCPNQNLDKISAGNHIH